MHFPKISESHSHVNSSSWIVLWHIPEYSQGVCWSHWAILLCLVKVQFRRVELYKEIEGINREEYSLPRIFRPSSLNWHTFCHIYILFLSQSSCHNTGAQELSANRTLWYITTNKFISKQSVVLFDNERNDGCIMKFYWQQFQFIGNKMHMKQGHLFTIISPPC